MEPDVECCILLYLLVYLMARGSGVVTVIPEDVTNREAPMFSSEPIALHCNFIICSKNRENSIGIYLYVYSEFIYSVDTRFYVNILLIKPCNIYIGLLTKETIRHDQIEGFSMQSRLKSSPF